ncbi:MAG: hypothetical protein ACI9MC_000038 [Kiritimatiellia bacterium]
MISNRLLLCAPLGAALFLSACDNEPTESTDAPVVVAGPTMSWTAPTSTIIEGEPFTVEVTAEDPEGVARVVTYFRTAGERTWSTAPIMVEEGGVWTIELPGDSVEPPALELYFKGDDEVGESAYLPAKGGQEPFSVMVQRTGLALPYAQTFEGSTNNLLREVGWTEKSLGFEGYDWSITGTNSAGGRASASHRRSSDGVTGEIEDWLISPTLDFTSPEKIQVSWMEYGDFAELSDHSLWISQGSPEPADGDFVEITSLSAPAEDAWDRSQTVELSEYSGQAAVTLAWVYKGVNKDAWWIDDVVVGPLGPDIRLTDVAWTPEPLTPGGEGVVTFTIDNRTNVAAADVSLSVSTDSDAVFDVPVSVGTVAGDTSINVDVPITIGSEHPPNAWLPVTVTLTSGETEWSFDERLLVGEPTIAEVGFTIEPFNVDDPEQLIRIYLGAGDPEDPEVEVTVMSALATSGTYFEEVDITDHWEHLAPLPNRRWWVRVETGPLGSVDQFNIWYGGEEYSSSNTGAFAGFVPSVYWLPAPPDPVLSRTTTDPSRVGPGDDVRWTLTLDNRGAATSGVTTVEVRSDDPDVTITDSGPVAISGDEGWATAQLVSPEFGFTVAADHKSSVPVRFIATIKDDYEEFEVPVDVAVPWPVLAVSGVSIDDFADGDNDGLLETGETANLEVDLTNVGGLSTFGVVVCKISITGGTAKATLIETEGFFGVIGPASTKDENDFEVSVSAGTKGDDIDFELACTDSEQSYTVPFEIVLGERPWIAITPTRDAVADNLLDYRFDFIDGQYRSDGTTLEIVLRSAKKHRGTTGLFIEAWANSSGATYSYYNFVAAGPTGTMRGYRGRSFSPLGTLKVTVVDDYSVKLEIDLTKLELRVDSLNIGFAAGFCGGTEQFCDHYPDGWGAPYTGLVTSRWVTLKL